MTGFDQAQDDVRTLLPVARLYLQALARHPDAEELAGIDVEAVRATVERWSDDG